MHMYDSTLTLSLDCSLMTQFQCRNLRVDCAGMECVNKYQRQLEAHLRRGHIGNINWFCLTQP